MTVGGEPADQAGVGYCGVLEQLKGLVAVARNDFDGAAVLATDLPVVVVQSTEDAFVSPKNAAVFQVTPPRGVRLTHRH